MPWKRSSHLWLPLTSSKLWQSFQQEAYLMEPATQQTQHQQDRPTPPVDKVEIVIQRFGVGETIAHGNSLQGPLLKHRVHFLNDERHAIAVFELSTVILKISCMPNQFSHCPPPSGSAFSPHRLSPLSMLDVVRYIRPVLIFRPQAIP